MNKPIYVCEQCGSQNVQIIAWIDANTNEYRAEACVDEIDYTWCVDCEEHVRLITKEKYETD